MLISFIIPVYNCAFYIKRCVNSIVSQSFEDYEILLVNDGSKDHSLDLCLSLAERYNNIRVFDQKENKGASSARNVGLNNAIGDFIWFVDSDDYVLPVIREVANILQSVDADLYAFDYEIQLKNHVTMINLNSRSIMLTQADFAVKGAPHYLWNRVYRHSSILELRFLDGTKNIEDLLFNIQFIKRATRFYYSPLPIYRYLDDNQDSTSRNRSVRNLVKLSQDTIDIQTILFEEMNSCIDVDLKIVLNNMFNTSLAGHIYSLFSFYNYKRVKKIIVKYREKGWYPIGYTSDNRKANLYIFVVNRRFFIKIMSIFFAFNKCLKKWR